MSIPARPASGPCFPNGETAPTTRRGYAPLSESQSRPSFSARPGRKLVSTTSAQPSKASITGRAVGSDRESGNARLLRLREMNVRDSEGAIGLSRLVGSPSSASTLMTSAPPSPSNCAAYGTATNCPNSTTRTPANGWSLSVVMKVPFMRDGIVARAGAGEGTPVIPHARVRRSCLQGRQAPREPNLNASRTSPLASRSNGKHTGKRNAPVN